MCFVLNVLCTQRSCKLRPIKKNCLHIHSHSMGFGFFYSSRCQLITIMNLILIKNDAGDQKATTAPCICGKRFINSSILNALIDLAMGIHFSLFYVSFLQYLDSTAKSPKEMILSLQFSILLSSIMIYLQILNASKEILHNVVVAFADLISAPIQCDLY